MKSNLYKKAILVIVFLLVLLPLPVLSAPPFETQILSEELTIFYPKIQYYPFESDSIMSFSVLNSSNSIQDNESVSCSFWVEKNDGSKIITEETLDFAEGYFFHDLNSTHTSEKGFYNYFIYCASDTEQGAVSSYFIVNGKGEEDSLNTIFAYLIPISLIFILFLLCFGLTIKSEGNIVKLTLANMTYLLGIVLFGSLWLFSGWFLNFIVIEALFYLLFIGLVILLFPFVTGTIIYAFLCLFADEKVAKLLIEGEYPDSIIEDEKNPFKRYMLRKNIERRFKK